MKETILYIFLVLAVFADARPPKDEEESAVDGPGMDSPVMPDSSDMSADELPMEHRVITPSVVLPLAVKEKSSYDLGHDLNAQLFFSMWFVFLNNGQHVAYSDAPFTILAPVDSAETQPEKLLRNETLAEDVLANHFLIGEAIRPEMLLKPLERYTEGGQKLVFKLDQADGSLWVNDAQILGWEKVGGNGMIFALSEYLFIEPEKKKLFEFPKLFNKVEENELEVEDETKMRKKPGSETESYFFQDDVIRKEKCQVLESEDEDGIFKSIVVCEEEFIDPKSDEAETIRKIKDVRKDDEDGVINSEPLPDFLQDIVDVLSVLRFGSNEFLEYIKTAGIDDAFEKGAKYTALIPFDEAFRAWKPIDWGFDPFQVRDFVREVLLDHFILGDVGEKADIADGATYKTLGGKDVLFTRKALEGKVAVNGVELVEGAGTPVPHGRLLFLNEILFVNHEMVKKLNVKYGYLESGPILPTPWYKSQFLSHVFQKLNKREEFSDLVEYMNATENFGSFAPSTSNGDVYTFFAPKDAAFWRILVQDATAPDPFLEDADFRLKTLLGHLVKGRLFHKDLIDGLEIETMAANKTLKVERKGNKVTLKDGRQSIKVLGHDEHDEDNYVYDLGNMFFIDRVLFTETSDVINVMEKLDKKDVEDEGDSVEDFGKDDDNLPRGKSELEFEEEFGEADYEEKVMYVNNQRVSILKKPKQ